MDDSLANQLLITAWDMVMSQLVISGRDELKLGSIGELAALMRMASSDELLSAVRAITRRWKARDAGKRHRTTFNDMLSLLGATRRAGDDLERTSIEGKSPNSVALAATEKAVAMLIGQTVSEVERVLVLGTLRQVGGNRTHAAEVLGISLRTLRNKLHQYAQDGEAIPTPLVVGMGLGRRHHIG